MWDLGELGTEHAKAATLAPNQIKRYLTEYQENYLKLFTSLAVFQPQMILYCNILLELYSSLHPTLCASSAVRLTYGSRFGSEIEISNDNMIQILNALLRRHLVRERHRVAGASDLPPPNQVERELGTWFRIRALLVSPLSCY